MVCCGSAPAAGRTNRHGALKEGSGIRLHALAESPAGGAGRGSPGQAGDRAGPNHTACGSRRKRRVRPGRSVPVEGIWDTHSGGKHRGLSAAGRTGWLSGRSCKGDGMRCWEISGGLRPSTSSVVIQICERGFNNYYSIVQGIEQPSPLYPAKIQPGPILQQPVPILWQTQRPAESIAVGIGRFCYFVQASG